MTNDEVARMVRSPQARKMDAYYSRLGGMIEFPGAAAMRVSRAQQICRTWRMHFAWRLAHTLGWR